jgi:hypothetical protein
MSTYLSGLKVPIKNIGGKMFRLNNLKHAQKVNEMENDEPKKDVREFKLLNLRRLESVYSDEESSEESNNNSFDDEINEEKFSEQDLLDVDSFLLFMDGDSQVINNEKGGKKIQPKFMWTHFIAFPYYTNKSFVEKYIFFRNTILGENFANINEHLFQQESRLHMTFCLLQLKNKEQLSLAQKLISESEKEINELTENFPITLDFDQFELMGTPNKTRVFYTRPDPNHESTEKTKDIIDILIRKLVDNQLLTKEMLQYSNISYNVATERYENQKLHVTLLNSTFLYRQMKKMNKNETIKPYFNGQYILKKMKHFNFGSTPTNNFVLYEMKVDKNGNYNQVTNFNFKI